MSSSKSYLRDFLGIIFIAIIFLFIKRAHDSNSKLTKRDIPYVYGDDYKKCSINGVVDSIFWYERGDPVVLIDSKVIRISLPSFGKEYLSINDSIEKKANNLDVKTFRFYSSTIECITWSYNDYDMDGMVSKKAIKK